MNMKYNAYTLKNGILLHTSAHGKDGQTRVIYFGWRGICSQRMTLNFS